MLFFILRFKISIFRFFLKITIQLKNICIQRFKMHAEIFFLCFIFITLDIFQFAKHSMSINALHIYVWQIFYHI